MKNVPAMSQYLWGISQLVNDPSSDILNIIQRRIFRKKDVNMSNNEDKQRIKVTDSEHIDTEDNANNDNAIATCSKNICEGKVVRSESIQVGNGATKYRHAAIQCKRSISKKTSKTTSVQQVSHKDHSTTTPCQSSITKKNAEIDTQQYTICQQHRQVFRALKDPSNLNRNEVKEASSLVMRFKCKLQSVFGFFSLNKIENIPHYHTDEEQCVKLYRSVSLEHVKRKKGDRKHKKRENILKKSIENTMK